MAYRGGRGGGGGGGRGRGRGSGQKYAKQEPFILFPDITLPEIRELSKEEENLARHSLKLHSYFKASPYYLEDAVTKKGEIKEIERFSDRNKVSTVIRRDSLSQVLELKGFPSELIQGSKGWQQQSSRKRVRWNPDSELQKLDILEKLEQREGKNEKEKKEKEKPEGENEEEEEDQENEGSEEEVSDDDYLQNVDFDDDEDDFNVEDDGDDEQIYQ